MSKNTCCHASKHALRKDEAWLRRELLMKQSKRVFEGVPAGEPKVIRHFLLPPNGPVRIVIQSQIVSLKTTDLPPRVEVEKLWRQSAPVTDNTAASAWLESQGINAARAADFDLVRLVPSSGVLPEWARTGNHSWKEPYHLVARMFDHNGIMRSVCAQRIHPPGQAGIHDVVTPEGYSEHGLILADQLCQLLLAEQVVGDGQPASEMVCQVGLEILTGFLPFLRRACSFSDADEHAPAVLGLLRGSWTENLSRRVPSGFSVDWNAFECGVRLMWR